MERQLAADQARERRERCLEALQAEGAAIDDERAMSRFFAGESSKFAWAASARVVRGLPTWEASPAWLRLRSRIR